MLEKTYSPAEVEAKLYGRWEKSGAFACDVASNAAPYTIMMPPPNVTGSLHMGHALTFTVQDILVRYNRMVGRDALWQPGTDHAGIATQMVVERNLAAEGVNRRDLGRDAFVEKVWEWKAEIRRHHRQPAAAPRGQPGLGARALHHGRGAVRGGASGVRPTLQGRADLPRQAAGELGSEVPDRNIRPRGRVQGSRRQPLAFPLPDRGRRGAPYRRRHHPSGDHAGRYRRGRAPGG